MSAIAGLWNLSGGLDPAPDCRNMLDALRAYGPHRTAQWQDAQLALGHNLYRTLPEDEWDAQPVIGGGGRYVLVADVRIDNRDELIPALGLDRADAAFFSDAMLLMRAWERWGSQVPEQLVADFAMVLWDRDSRVIHLARDPTGQRPLYYHKSPHLFAFASLAKGLHALSAVPRRVDPEAMAEFIALVPEHGRRSQYEGIDQVPPGHWMTVTPQRETLERHWRPRRRDLGLKGFDAHKEALRHELDRAVAVRLRGAGPRIATHLSGGWDSSAVTSTAARLNAGQGGRVLAFTATARGEVAAPFGRISDEAPLARATAALYPNIEHNIVAGLSVSPLQDADLFLERFDRPIYSLCNFVWLTEIRRRAAAQGAKVLLTGEVGNYGISASPANLLADYLREGRWRDWWREARAVRRVQHARYRGIAATSFGPWIPDSLWRHVRRFSSRPDTRGFSALNPRLEQRVAALRERLGVGLSRRPKDNLEHVVQSIAAYDFGNYRKGALAGWGLDERDPTADRRLLEFCLSLPLEMLLHEGERRPLSRAVLSDRVPQVVLEERRKGLQAADWYEGMGKDLATALAIIDRAEASPLAAELLDLPSMRRWIQAWPKTGWDRADVAARYRGALLNGLSAAHFILSVEGQGR